MDEPTRALWQEMMDGFKAQRDAAYSVINGLASSTACWQLLSHPALWTAAETDAIKRATGFGGCGES